MTILNDYENIVLIHSSFGEEKYWKIFYIIDKKLKEELCRKRSKSLLFEKFSNFKNTIIYRYYY